MNMNDIDLSIIIVSFNTKELTIRCLHELDVQLSLSPSVRAEVIVVDNASSDGSEIALSKIHLDHAVYVFVSNRENVGFSKGNNIGLRKSRGKYVLYINSDVMVHSKNSLVADNLIHYMDSHEEVGALTVRVERPDGNVDMASHRGLPTLWRSFTYFMGLEKLIQYLHITDISIREMLGGYHLLEKNLIEEHEIDSGTAAFLFCRGSVIRNLEGFDEQFFMYGEDLDLCFRIKEKGMKIIWYPTYTVLHFKYQSGLGSRDMVMQRRIRWHFYDAMERFFRKHYERKYGFGKHLVYMILKIIKYRYQ